MGNLKIKRNLEMDTHGKHAFNILMVNAQYYSNDSRVFAITSCRDKEGKSFIAYRMASTFAEEGKKTILILADCRKTMGNRDRTLMGLTEVLEGTMTLEDAVYETDITNMNIMFVGDRRVERKKIMDCTAFESLISKLRTIYDIVIIDTATVGKTENDTVIYSSCDAAILVLEPNKVARKLIRHVRRIIESTRCVFLGMVFNNKL